MPQRWKILAVLTFARASMGYQFQSIAAVTPFISADLALDKAQLGWLIGIYLLPGVAIALPGGLLGARYGDKRVALLGLALMAVGGLWLALAGSALEANAARIVGGTGAVLLNVLFTKMVADWFEGRERVLAMSGLVNAWPIGIGIALFAVGPLGEAAGWQVAIASTAAFAACGFAAVLAWYRPPAAPTQPAATSVGLGALTAREWRLLCVASLPWLVYNAAYQILVSFLPSFFLENGLSIAGSGAVTALNTLLIVVSVQAGGIILKRATRPDLVCHAAILGWCATVLLLSGASHPLLWIVLGGLIAGLPAGAFVSLPAEFLRPETRAAGMGVFYTIYYLGCAFLPGAAGLLYDASGSARATLWMAALLAFACVPTLILFRWALRRA
ncbi:MAG TPA: MFS transporter [Burkholderiales bacterium]